jgi:hypothetical protein
MLLSAIAPFAFASLLPAGNGLSWIQRGISTCARNPLRSVRPCSGMRADPRALCLKAPDFRNPNRQSGSLAHRGEALHLPKAEVMIPR